MLVVSLQISVVSGELRYSDAMNLLSFLEESSRGLDSDLPLITYLCQVIENIIKSFTTVGTWKRKFYGSWNFLQYVALHFENLGQYTVFWLFIRHCSIDALSYSLAIMFSLPGSMGWGMWIFRYGWAIFEHGTARPFGPPGWPYDQGHANLAPIWLYLMGLLPGLPMRLALCYLFCEWL